MCFNQFTGFGDEFAYMDGRKRMTAIGLGDMNRKRGDCIILEHFREDDSYGRVRPFRFIVKGVKCRE